MPKRDKAKTKMYNDVMYGKIKMSDFKPVDVKEVEKLLQSEPDERKKVREEVMKKVQSIAPNPIQLPSFGQPPGAPQGPPKMFEKL